MKDKRQVYCARCRQVIPPGAAKIAVAGQWRCEACEYVVMRQKERI